MKIVDPVEESTTRLSGRRLGLARAIWLVLTIVYFSMLAISMPTEWEAISRS